MILAMALQNVPHELRDLVKQLAALRSEQRQLVVRAAEQTDPAARPRYPAMPWELIEKSIGVVSLGGDAVADCEALYDG